MIRRNGWRACFGASIAWIWPQVSFEKKKRKKKFFLFFILKKNHFIFVVDYCLIRDIDSRINMREQRATEDWLKRGAQFMTTRKRQTTYKWVALCFVFVFFLK